MDPLGAWLSLQREQLARQGYLTLAIRVATRAKESKLQDIGSNNVLRIRVQAPPADGKANEAVVRLIAQAFEISTARIEIQHGHSSPSKIIEIHRM